MNGLSDIRPPLAPPGPRKTAKEGDKLTVLLEFSMFPLVKGEGLGPFAARSLDFIDRNRIECSIKLDYRKGRRGRPEAKVAGVEQKLARPLNN